MTTSARLLLLAPLALLCACDDPPQGQPVELPEAVPAAPDVVPPLSGDPVGALTGEYRVAGIDGGEIDTPFAMTLSVTEERIVFDAPCGGFAWDFTLRGTSLSLSRIRAPEPACVAVSRIHSAVFDLAAAMDEATSAVRTPSNGIELVGGGRSLILYSQ